MTAGSILDLDAARGGLDLDADVVVVGSGAGGAMAARTLSQAGLRVVVVEAGPRVTREEMATLDGPAFLSRYYWEGGLRMLLGSGAYPTMSGRCLGGSTVVNSAIAFRLPGWVRDDWIASDGLDVLRGPALDVSYDRVFNLLKVGPTPMDVMGRKDHVARDVLTRAGIPNNPLPRAVSGCRGSGRCLTGCPHEAKQSVDRSVLPDAVAAGTTVITCAPVDRLLIEGGRVVGVTGHITEPVGRARVGPFTVRAPRVVLSAGALHTPVLMQRSGITLGGRVGGTFQAHISALSLGIMPDPVRPWQGATQGWGGFSDRVQGMKFESLWGPTALFAAEWGGLGHDLYRVMRDVQHAAMVVLVYRAKVRGSVRAKRDGLPFPQLWIPKEEMHVVMRELHRVVLGFLDEGARYVYTGVRGVPDEIRTRADADALLSPRIRPRHVTMTANHVFGSCRMSADPRRGVTDPFGKVHDVDGLWIADASLFPSPSAVNPQATVMALADLVAGRLAEQAVA